MRGDCADDPPNTEDDAAIEEEKRNTLDCISINRRNHGTELTQ